MVCKVKSVTKSGEEKVYEYDHKKYYDNYKQKHGKIICLACAQDVNKSYLVNHMKTNKCIKKSAARVEDPAGHSPLNPPIIVEIPEDPAAIVMELLDCIKTMVDIVKNDTKWSITYKVITK